MVPGPTRLSWVLALSTAVACGDAPSDAPFVTPRVSYASSAGFWDAPFPSPHRLRPDGSYDLGGLAEPGRSRIFEQVLALAADVRGFGVASPIYFPLDGRIDPSSLTVESVMLVNVERGSGRYGEHAALDVSLKVDAESYSPENVVALVPRPGRPLAPGARHAAFLTRRVRDTKGRPIGRAASIAHVLGGTTPAGDRGAATAAALAPAMAWATEGGLRVDEIAAVTIFRTADPFSRVKRLRDAVASRAPPTLTSVALLETYDDFCVLGGRIALPVYQQGQKPYDKPGEGRIVEDPAGAPLPQSSDDASFTLSLPRSAMPAAGYPFVVYAAGGGGTSRQVVDRTREAENPDEGRGPRGRGPAMHLARRGIASFSVAAPITADRNPAGQGGDVEFFNVNNLTAFRDNVVQSVLDLTLVFRALERADIAASSCPGTTGDAGGRLRLDGSRPMFWGHSTGSTVGGVLLGVEPLRAAMLSGAGGTWAETLLFAESPVRYKNIARFLLGYSPGDDLDAFDPALGLFQMAMDATDVTNWATRPAARNLLFVHGIYDTYHPPTIVPSYAIAAQLEVVDPVVDAPSVDRIRAAGGRVVGAPREGGRLMVQRRHAEGTDGHYVAFELDELKRVYACWFESAARDRATVVSSAPAAALPCP